MKTKWECPPCYYQMHDCVANDSGVCIALSSTYFKRGKCPFYKPKKEKKKQDEE